MAEPVPRKANQAPAKANAAPSKQGTKRAAEQSKKGDDNLRAKKAHKKDERATAPVAATAPPPEPVAAAKQPPSATAEAVIDVEQNDDDEPDTKAAAAAAETLASVGNANSAPVADDDGDDDGTGVGDADDDDGDDDDDGTGVGDADDDDGDDDDDGTEDEGEKKAMKADDARTPSLRVPFLNTVAEHLKLLPKDRKVKSKGKEKGKNTVDDDDDDDGVVDSDRLKITQCTKGVKTFRDSPVLEPIAKLVPKLTKKLATKWQYAFLYVIAEALHCLDNAQKKLDAATAAAATEPAACVDCARLNSSTAAAVLKAKVAVDEIDKLKAALFASQSKYNKRKEQLVELRSKLEEAEKQKAAPAPVSPPPPPLAAAVVAPVGPSAKVDLTALAESLETDFKTLASKFTDVLIAIHNEDEIKSLQAQVAELKKKFDAKRDECDQLQTALDESAQSLADKTSSETAAVLDMQDAKASLAETQNSLKEAKARAAKTISDLTASLQSDFLKVTTAKDAEIAEVRSQVDVLKKAADGHAKSLAEKDAQIKAVLDDKTTAEAALEQNKQALVTFRAEVAAKDDRLDLMARELKEATTQLRESLAAKTTECEEANKQRMQALDDTAFANDHAKQMQHLYGFVSVALEKCSAELKSSAPRLTVLRSHVNMAMQQIHPRGAAAAASTTTSNSTAPEASTQPQ